MTAIPLHTVAERKTARAKKRRVWDVYDSEKNAVLEIVSNEQGLHVFDGDSNKLAFVPCGDTRSKGVA